MQPPSALAEAEDNRARCAQNRAELEAEIRKTRRAYLLRMHLLDVRWRDANALTRHAEAEVTALLEQAVTL